MAIEDYGTLQPAISDWLNRGDLLADTIELFTQMAEAELNGEVFVQSVEQEATDALTGSTLSHPAGMIEARRLTVNGKLHYYRSPEVFSSLELAGNVAQVFTSVGQTFHILGAKSGDVYKLIYRGTLPPVYRDGTNWLLQRAPDVYLWACCKHGAVYLQDDAAAARFAGMYRNAVARINNSEKLAAVSGSALQMAPSVRE